MKKVLNLLLGATALVSANAATVQGLMAQEANWSGFYAGILFGIGQTTFNGTATAVGENNQTITGVTFSTIPIPFCPYGVTVPTSACTVPLSTSFLTITDNPAQYLFDEEDFTISDESFLAGAKIGAQIEILPNIVVGGAIDYILADFEATHQFGADSFAILTLGLDRITTARAIVGVPMGIFMPYATAGLAAGHVWGRLETNFPDGGDPLSFYDDEWALGYAAGAGLMVQATSNIWIDLTYLHVELGEVNFVFENLNGIYGTADFTTSSDIFTVALVFKLP